MSETMLTPDSHPDWRDYHPADVRLQDNPPHPAARRILWTLAGLLAFLIAWSWWGQLDVIAQAEGRLIPAARLKIIQPAEAGVIREIHVREGDQVRAGQILISLDGLETETDTRALLDEQARLEVEAARLRAELAGDSYAPPPGIPQPLARASRARFDADQAALSADLAEQQARLDKAEQELATARQQKVALEAVLPYYRKREQALARLSKKGGATRLQIDESRRQRIEKEQAIETQQHLIASARAGIELARKKLAGIQARHILTLHERQQEISARLEQLSLGIRKQHHRESQLLLRAPGDGIVKQLATHTVGTVVQPGTILASLVPEASPLQAEIWLSNADIGFAHPDQSVQLKVAAYPFQKYGMLEGRLSHISPDAQSGKEARNAGLATREQAALRYRGLVDIDGRTLQHEDLALPLHAGMRVTAEIRLGTRSIADYLLSPISGAWHEAARER